ncbi:hypothetical protein [Rhodopirellula islandica]|nr:hypothetical protein [Rhodopirellula islandica]
MPQEPDPDVIRPDDDPVRWDMLMAQITEAHMHLGQLITEIEDNSAIDEIDTMIQLGHIYAHLNRFWHGRNVASGDIDALYTDENSDFPNDVTLS